MRRIMGVNKFWELLKKDLNKNIRPINEVNLIDSKLEYDATKQQVTIPKSDLLIEKYGQKNIKKYSTAKIAGTYIHLFPPITLGTSLKKKIYNA